MCIIKSRPIIKVPVANRTRDDLDGGGVLKKAEFQKIHGEEIDSGG